MVTERDAAVEERDAAVTERDAAMEERDAAVTERDAAMEERDDAVTERDAAMEERDEQLTALVQCELEYSFIIGAFSSLYFTLLLHPIPDPLVYTRHVHIYCRVHLYLHSKEGTLNGMC